MIEKSSPFRTPNKKPKQSIRHFGHKHCIDRSPSPNEVSSTFKPNLCQKSMHLGTILLSPAPKRKPLYQRIDQLVQAKDYKVQQLKASIDAHKEDYQSTFSPKINKSRHNRSISFLESCNQWEENRRRNLEKAVVMKNCEDLREITFKPKINKKSVEILSRVNF